MNKLIYCIAVSIFLTSCTDPSAAQKALQGAGYSNIQIEGYAFFGCSDKDTFSTKFSATGPTGIPTEGVVCSGWLKGATIRTY